MCLVCWFFHSENVAQFAHYEDASISLRRARLDPRTTIALQMAFEILVHWLLQQRFRHEHGGAPDLPRPQRP